MFKISRLTDYSVIILRSLHKASAGSDVPLSAREIAVLSALPLPTVQKLLKVLASKKIILAHRGAKGGYQISDDARNISLLKILEALEGPQAITSCISNDHRRCQIEDSCPQQDMWTAVNHKIMRILAETSVFELFKPHNSLPLIKG